MTDQNEKRKRAVEINFEIRRFKEELVEELKARMRFKGIEKIVDCLGMVIALYYQGTWGTSARKAPCNIMLSHDGSRIENCINYSSYRTEDEERKIINVVEGKIQEEIKKKLSGINEIDFRCKEIKYGQKAEFSAPILIVFGVYDLTNEGVKIKHQIYKKLILDFLMQTINNMSDFDKFTQDNSAFWNDISYNFIENYKEIVFEQCKLPDIELVEQVSRSPYERRECRGGVVFVNSGESVKDIVKLDSSNEWSFKDTEFVRKMLEIATKNRYLFVQSEESYRIEGFGFKSEEDLNKHSACIKFRGSFSYSVFSMGEEILRCENGSYYPATEDIEFSIDEICSRYKNIPGLKSIMQKRDRIEHGAIYIFAEDAQDICDILCRKYKRGTIVETFIIRDREDFFVSLSAVDGAVLADMNGNCYAYGVILDGEAKVEADLTRGSRYNSAKNYVHRAKRLAVVISEDKEREPDIIPGWEVGI